MFIKGVLMLAGIPALIVMILIVFLGILPSLGILLLDRTLVIVVVLYPAVIYAYLMIQKVAYSDLDILDKVTIPGAPEGIVSLLKTTTRGTNRLVNVEIISTLGYRNLVQNRLIDEVKKKGISLTATRIIEYLEELEHHDILESQKAYKREYSLTETGKWCCQVVKVCFPRRQFWFIIRYNLAYQKISIYPKASNREIKP
jgi:predicted transcriptional regulator